jgi:hypothetical protein
MSDELTLSVSCSRLVVGASELRISMTEGKVVVGPLIAKF